MEFNDKICYEMLGNQKIAVLDCDKISNIEISRAIAAINYAKGNDDPFHVYNLNTIVKRFALWHSKLPRVKPYYAVKCNDNPVLIRVLAALGVGFDCASRQEIDLIVELGVNPMDRIVYANPCKTSSFVKHALRVGVRLMTFDGTEELLKIKAEHDDPQLILRIAVGDPNAQCPLSVKFGCDPPLEEGIKLLQLAAKHNMPVVGISFHVGSGCNTPSVFRDALLIARALFNAGETIGHKNMHILDIGGGFPGEDTERVSFDKIVNVVSQALDELFPDDGNVDVIAEPGRFFAAAAVSEVANVIARKRVSASRITKNVKDTRAGFMYYINDGVYGSFNCILFDHANPRGFPLFEVINAEIHPTTIWGPTCDGLDQIEVEREMRELQTGDWIFYPSMGAYTNVASTNFNGFDKPNVYYVIDTDNWKLLFGAVSLVDSLGCGGSSDETANELVGGSILA